MNRTFDIEEDTSRDESPETENKPKVTDSKKEENIFSLGDTNKRQSLLIFEAETSSNQALNEEFLENELIPDDLLDEIHNFIEPSSNLDQKDQFKIKNSSFLFSASSQLNTQSEEKNLISNTNCENLNEDENNSSFKKIKLEKKVEKTLISSKQLSKNTNNTIESSSLDFIPTVNVQNEVKKVLESVIEKLCQLDDCNSNPIKSSLNCCFTEIKATTSKNCLDINCNQERGQHLEKNGNLFEKNYN